MKIDAGIQNVLEPLRRIQYRDFRPLRNKPLHSEEVRNFLDSLAEEIADVSRLPAIAEMPSAELMLAAAFRYNHDLPHIIKRQWHLTC